MNGLRHLNPKSTRLNASQIQPPFGCLKHSATLAVLGLSMSLTFAPGARAANTISLEYGPIQRNLPYSDLQSFADTNKPSGLLADLIAFSKREPDKMHKLLTASIPVKVTAIDRLVNSYLGEVLLTQVGQVILPAGGGDPVKALRAGLVGGVQNDQLSLLSFLRSYPVDMRINGQRLMEIKKQVDEDKKYLPEIASGLQGILSKFLPGLSLGPGGGASGSTSPTPSPSASPTP